MLQEDESVVSKNKSEGVVIVFSYIKYSFIQYIDKLVIDNKIYKFINDDIDKIIKLNLEKELKNYFIFHCSFS